MKEKKKEANDCQPVDFDSSSIPSCFPFKGLYTYIVYHIIIHFPIDRGGEDGSPSHVIHHQNWPRPPSLCLYLLCTFLLKLRRQVEGVGAERLEDAAVEHPRAVQLVQPPEALPCVNWYGPSATNPYH